jgi:hypothetical protein
MIDKTQIESVLDIGRFPIKLRMSDGREYLVPHRDYIWLPPNSGCAFVYDDTGRFTILPFLSMSGLNAKNGETA